MVYQDGSREAVSQSSLEVGKENTFTEFLLEAFESMECGQILQGVGFNSQPADIVLTEKSLHGCAEPVKVEESICSLYACETAVEPIQTRIQTARMGIDQGRFNSIEMPLADDAWNTGRGNAVRRQRCTKPKKSKRRNS